MNCQAGWGELVDSADIKIGHGDVLLVLDMQFLGHELKVDLSLDPQNHICFWCLNAARNDVFVPSIQVWDFGVSR